jgi:hypothetical protein
MNESILLGDQARGDNANMKTATSSSLKPFEKVVFLLRNIIKKTRKNASRHLYIPAQATIQSSQAVAVGQGVTLRESQVLSLVKVKVSQ